jgi:hypothetical protein
MDLQFESGRLISGAEESDLARIESEDFAILSDGIPFIQCAVRRDKSSNDYVLEYQDGSYDEHYRAADEQITLDRVLAAFRKYMRKDSSWRTEFRWEKVAPEGEARDHFWSQIKKSRQQSAGPTSEEQHPALEGCRASCRENEGERDEERDALNDFSSEVYNTLMDEYRQSFPKDGVFEGAGLSQIAFQCVYLAVLMRVTAMIAVDIGMESERFLTMAAKSHEEAYTAGPTKAFNTTSSRTT